MTNVTVSDKEVSLWLFGVIAEGGAPRLLDGDRSEVGVSVEETADS
jgi:hypothetical protein